MSAIVSFKHVSKSYTLDRVVVNALTDVSFEVERGAFVAVSGPSGSGKSTLLNLIGCVDTPSEGCVESVGKNTQALSDRELTQLRLRDIGFIFQSFNLIGVLSVFRNVELPLLLLGGMSASQRRERVTTLLRQVGIERFAQHRPGELSGGQRQRAAIARALVTGPRLVLADEPTANLDSSTAETIIELMKSLNRTEQTTFIFATHDARMLAHAESMIELVDGRLAQHAMRRAS